MFKTGKPKKDIYCLNCGYPLHGDENFCPYCGQKNDTRPLSIKKYFQTFIGNIFNADARIWQTIIQLIKRPGYVALQYIQGKRTKFSNPFRLLFQIGIIYFLILGISESLQQKNNKLLVIHFNKDSISIDDSLINHKLDSIDQQIHFVKILKNDSINFETRNKIYNIAFDKFNNSKQHPELNIYSSLKKYLLLKGISIKYYPQLDNIENFERKSIAEKTFELFDILNNEIYRKSDNKQILKRLQISDNISNKLAIIFALKLNNLMYDKKGRKEFKKSLMSKITAGLFFVLPIFGFFVWLLYFRKKLSYTDTLVWIFYAQSVFFILMLIELILELLSINPLLNIIISYLSLIIYAWFTYYLFKTVKNIYGETKIKTFFKLILYIIPVYLTITGAGLLFLSLLSFIW